jgi:diguanylate cyclase (GGDEF)-like protein/PAS domain S-box-containing protein
MNNQRLSVLLVESDSTESELIRSGLEEEGNSLFHVECVTRLTDALKCLERKDYEVVLLDLTLPDGSGIELFERVNLAAPNALIQIITPVQNIAIAREAVLRGAYDYFQKEQLDLHLLRNSLRHILASRSSRLKLQNSEMRFRTISDASPLGIFVSDEAGNCIYTNEAYQQISGLSFKQTLGTNWNRAVHPDDRERIDEVWINAINNNARFNTEFRFLQRDGKVVWTRVNGAPMKDAVVSRGFIQTVENITQRKAIEFGLEEAKEALFVEKERAQVTLNSIGDAVICTDITGKITYLNRAAEVMTGWANAEALGEMLEAVFTIFDRLTHQTTKNPAMHAIEKGEIVGLSANCVLVRRDGSEVAIEDSASPIHDRSGEVIGAVLVFHDVTHSRTIASKMTYLAQHDFLTGLPNRPTLIERLTQAVALAQRHRSNVALMFLDLDDFKHINDSLGHATGDLLLQSVAKRLVSTVRATDTVCRQGGDEFVVLLGELTQSHDTVLVVENLLKAFETPHLIEGRELYVTTSIGISIYPNDASTVDVLMQNADTAMFQAKAMGRNKYRFYQAEMNGRAIHRMNIENSLRRALRDNEFLLHYQPQIDIASSRLAGSEALIRWRDPILGLVQPQEFVSLAELSGLIVPIGRWVLREACRQTKTWLDAGLNAMPVAVNVSALEFRQKNFLAAIALILQETGLPPEKLELELTESMLMQDSESAVSVLQTLKDLGVKLAIDDFGTGFSSLRYLKRFPIDTLKIDQSFVNDVTTNADDATIVSAVIGMGKHLHQRVIAEGVETEKQLDFLMEQQCDMGQGFYFSHPLSAHDYGLFLEKESSSNIPT